MAAPNDALAMLHAEHRQVDALFQQYADTSEAYLKQIIAEHVCAELELHVLLEETLLYPAYAAQAGEAGQRCVAGALQEHQQGRECRAALQDIDDDVTFEAGFQVLRDHVAQHIEDEEAMMVPFC